MDVLLKSVTIVDPNAPNNGQQCDVIISNGIITKIGTSLEAPANAEVVTGDGLHASPGWFDLHVNFRDPGHEYKEDLTSGVNAAAAGGFTGVMVMPSTEPPIDKKADVEYVINKAAGAIVDVYPAGALSNNLEGKEIAEMYDMHNAGAKAFTDDKHAVASAGVMTRALMYAKNFDGLIISFPHDENMAKNGQMNEGASGTRLGLKGIPALAEELHVARDIFLTEYTDAKLHFCTISTAKSVALIREAKAKGQQITAEVAAHQLLLDDTVLEEFDSNYKVMPPLRTNNDIKALIEGLKDGTIDAISSDHTPEDEEHKKCEFDRAAFGIIGLETAYAALNTGVNGALSQDELVQKLAINPRTILQMEVPTIKEGATANITLFNPNQEWVFGENDLRSKSKNTPFVGTTFTGKVLGVINNNQLLLN